MPNSNALEKFDIAASNVDPDVWHNDSNLVPIISHGIGVVSVDSAAKAKDAA